ENLFRLGTTGHMLFAVAKASAHALHAELYPGFVEHLLVDFAVTLRSSVILDSFPSHRSDKFGNSRQSGSGFLSPGHRLPRRLTQHFTKRTLGFLLFSRPETHTESLNHFSLSRVRQHLYLLGAYRAGKGKRQRTPLQWSGRGETHCFMTPYAHAFHVGRMPSQS